MGSNAGIDQALQLVSEHFRGITDEDGEPYLMHCLRVMRDVGPNVEAQIVALMHDLVEDTPVTLQTLAAAGFSTSVVAAVGLITHTDELSYAEYVIQLKPNPLARAAKMSDLRDNASLRRVLYRQTALDSDLRRIQKYILSYKFLDDRISQADYSRRMHGCE